MQAQEGNEVVEALSQRTESVTVAANPDGSITRKDFGTPIRVRRDGEWVGVDYTLIEQPDGTFAPRAANADVSLGPEGSKEAGKVTFADRSSLAVTWPQPLPRPTIKGGTATYAVTDTSDLVVSVTGAGLAVRLRLNEEPKSGEDTFTLGLKSKHLEVTEHSSGGLSLRSDGGQLVGETAALTAWDDTEDRGGAPADPVNLSAELSPEQRVSGSTSVQTLDLTPPAGFLSDPDTDYPVVVDPDISGLSKLRDTWTRSGDEINRSASPYLYVGKIDGSPNTAPARSYLKFHSGTIEGKDVVEAELKLWQYYAHSCDAAKAYAYPVADFWTSKVMWANRPRILAVGESTSVTENRGSQGCARGMTGFDVSSMVMSWARGDYVNEGIRLHAGDETTHTAERRFCSMDPDTSTSICNAASRAPYLEVTYFDDDLEAPSPTPDLGPTPIAGSVLTAPTSGSTIETIFDLPIKGGAFRLAAAGGGKVAVVRNGQTLGTYHSVVNDYGGAEQFSTVSAVGQQLKVATQLSTSAHYPLAVQPVFTAADTPEALSLYPDLTDVIEELDAAEGDASTPVDPHKSQELIDATVAQIVATQSDGESSIPVLNDVMGAEPGATPEPDENLNEDLVEPDQVTDPEPAPTESLPSGVGEASGPKTIRPPKWGKYYPPKHYLYDPRQKSKAKYGSKWEKAWHDYCTTGPDAYGKASFRGPCARHDLCIEFKQSPHRKYCDWHFLKTLKINCKVSNPNTSGPRSPGYSNPAQQRQLCYSRSAFYYTRVRDKTREKTDAGQFGHSRRASFWPRYRYDRW